MIRALRHRTYRTLFTAQIVSLLGSGLATVALGLLAYDLSGDRASLVLGALFAVKMVAYVVVAPVAAAALRSLPRRSVMVASDLIRVAVALLLPFVAHTWQIFVLVFVLQAASAAFIPTYQATLPAVLTDEDDYTGALSLSRLVEDLETIGSPLVAALLLVFLPVHDLFFGTAIGFAASAVLVLAVALPARGARSHITNDRNASDQVADEQAAHEQDAHEQAAHEQVGDEPERPWGEHAREGMALFFRTPSLRPILLLNLVVAASVAYVLVQTVVIVRARLGLSDQWVALFLAVNGAGAIVAASTLGAVLARLGERRLMLGSAVVLVALTAATGVVVSVEAPLPVQAGAIAAAWLAIGAAWAWVETPMGRIIRRATLGRQPDQASLDQASVSDQTSGLDQASLLDQAYAAQFSLSHACWLLTYPLVGLLGQLGLGVAAWVMAGVAALAAGAAIVVWPVSLTDQPTHHPKGSITHESPAG